MFHFQSLNSIYKNIQILNILLQWRSDEARQALTRKLQWLMFFWCLIKNLGKWNNRFTNTVEKQSRAVHIFDMINECWKRIYSSSEWWDKNNIRLYPLLLMLRQQSATAFWDWLKLFVTDCKTVKYFSEV